MTELMLKDAGGADSHIEVPETDSQTFARELRAERLAMLWRVTLVAAVIVLWGMLIYATLDRAFVFVWALSMGMIILGSLLTGIVLRRGAYTAAVWVYAGGVLGGVAALLFTPPGLVRTVAPYTFVLLVFVVGMLLSPRWLPVLWLLTSAISLGVPALFDRAFTPDEHQIAAVVMSALAVLVVIQVTGELYAIAQWALMSYRRERERKLQLHESQAELEKTLARVQVLAENLEEARATAEEAKNFRGQFLANMSHELRTPLNAVIGFSDTMLHYPEMYDDVSLPEEYHRDLAQIYNSGTQLLHVINDILDLSKVDAGKLDVVYEQVNLIPILRAAMATATGLVGDKPVKLLHNVPDELPLVWADANRVRQVLLNLYSNATKFTDEGAITLGIDLQPEEIIISVKDTGVGIPPEEHDLIFEEFRQGKSGHHRKVTGSGLGLSISRHLIRLMNGQIWVESVVGEGSTFYFSLPRIDQSESNATAGEVSSARLRAR
ncbi:MAG: hypothetical protein JXN59_14275 [Anaerolineae bacterium]|nr:hypothetical protein [Anaerolineae bacterium]